MLRKVENSRPTMFFPAQHFYFDIYFVEWRITANQKAKKRNSFNNFLSLAHTHGYKMSVRRGKENKSCSKTNYALSYVAYLGYGKGGLDIDIYI